LSNIYIRNLYSPGFSSITFSFYKTNLSIRFTPWINKNQAGRSQYDTKRFVSTTISDESAASLYYLATKIVDDDQSNPVQYLIQCNNQTILRFEYDENKAILIIEKDGERIIFEFAVHQYRVKENGQVVTKIIQAGLLAFSEVLYAYLTAIGEDVQHEPQPETEFSESQSHMPVYSWR